MSFKAVTFVVTTCTRPPDEDSDLTLGQLVPILRSLDEVQDLGREHACVLHIVFRDASKGPLLLGQMERLSAQLLPQELLHLPVFAIDSAEILRDGVLAGTDLTTKSKATHSKVCQCGAVIVIFFSFFFCEGRGCLRNGGACARLLFGSDDS